MFTATLGQVKITKAFPWQKIRTMNKKQNDKEQYFKV